MWNTRQLKEALKNRNIIQTALKGPKTERLILLKREIKTLSRFTSAARLSIFDNLSCLKVLPTKTPGYEDIASKIKGVGFADAVYAQTRDVISRLRVVKFANRGKLVPKYHSCTLTVKEIFMA